MQGGTAFHWDCVQRSYQWNGISSLASWTYLQNIHVRNGKRLNPRTSLPIKLVQFLYGFCNLDIARRTSTLVFSTHVTTPFLSGLMAVFWHSCRNPGHFNQHSERVWGFPSITLSGLFRWMSCFLHVRYIPLHNSQWPFWASVLLMPARQDDTSPSGNTCLGNSH